MKITKSHDNYFLNVTPDEFLKLKNRFNMNEYLTYIKNSNCKDIFINLNSFGINYEDS